MAPPFLSVAADAVCELQGDVSNLWMMFTKCKESLHEGQRLENISWRLWYREMASGRNHTLTPQTSRRKKTVGRVIVDMLANDSMSSSHPGFGSVPASTASPDQRPTHCQLPTPVSSENSLSALPMHDDQPTPPSIQFIPLASTTPPQQPSRVVIVNPTPGPSHHPTPPTTPIISGAGGGVKPRVHLGAARRSNSGRAGMTGAVFTRRTTSSNKEGKKEEKKRRFNIGNSNEGAPKSGESGSVGSRRAVKPMVEEPPSSSVQSAKPRAVVAPSQPPVPPGLPTLSSQHPLPHPSAVIPQVQQRRTTIVLATSESEYETENDRDYEGPGQSEARAGAIKDDEDGDWSSEEDVSTGDVDVVVRREPPQPQPQPLICQDPPADHQSQPNLPPNAGILVTTTTTTISHNRPSDPPSRPLHLSRAQQQRQAQAAIAQYTIEQAALEAQRQGEMFTKKQVPSAKDLAAKRTRSGGLLSQLMNPDPGMFPVNHPYRCRLSSGEIRREMTSIVGVGRTVSAGHANGKGERREVGGGGTPLGAPPGVRAIKGSAPVPVAFQVQVGTCGATGGGSGMANGVGGAGRQPKGRPAGQEMEDDTDSDSDGDARNTMLVWKSMALEKLKALAARRGIATHQQPEKRDVIEEEDPVPRWVWERSKGHNNVQLPYAAPGANTSAAALAPRATPDPIPVRVGHPYNLPAPTAPSTPRTTRRLMLQTEMSESLRRNLLWERQVSKVNLAGVRRTASGSGKNGSRPMTTMPSIVTLTPKKAGAARGEVYGPAGLQAGRVEGEVERDERHRLSSARNRSWAADDYHYTGW